MAADKHGILSVAEEGKTIKATNPIKVQDLTLRDGHQSLFATRGRTEDMIPVAEALDNIGFYSIEVWGGATFDTMHRFLNEDPWERIRTLKRYIKKTPFSMLLRGQNLVGYRNYADDVADAFVERACENGMDIFRVFDALNDYRNFKTVVKVIKKNKKHFQGTICYSLTERKMGGDVYNLNYYLDKAKQLEEMGADTICIKDMAGLMAPYDAYNLIKALKGTVKAPLHLHSHFTSGMADLAMLKAIEAGVDIIDTCMSPYAYRTSHPAIEPLVVTLQGTDRDTGFNLEELIKIDEKLEEIVKKYRHILDDTKLSIIDTNVLLHQTPGGMLSNLVNQLREMDALDKLPQVFKELPRVRKELGQVPLVTPTSQIVGIQTVNNVLFDNDKERYKMITSQVKDLCYGLYGKTAIPIDKDIQKKALRDYARGKMPIDVRPADILEPELEKAKKDIGELAKDMDDIVLYAIYPTTGERFLKWKYGIEAVPDNVKPITLEYVQKQEELIAKAKRGELVEKSEKPLPAKGAAIKNFNVFVDNEYFSVEVEEVDGKPEIKAITPADAPKTAPAPEPAAKQAETSETGGFVKPAPKADKKPPIDVDGVPVISPMPGSLIRFEVAEGDEVEDGDVVAIIEAMKMENAITASTDGIIKSLIAKPGEALQKGSVILTIEEE